MPTQAELQAEAERLQAQADEALAAAAAAKEVASKPRTEDDIFAELIHAILMHLGNPPRAAALYQELLDFKAAQAQPAEAPAESSVDTTSGQTS